MQIFNPFQYRQEELNDPRLNPRFAPQAYGFVAASDAWLFAEPSPLKARNSQLLYGERISIHAQEGDFFLIQNIGDGYCGWLHRSMVQITPKLIPEPLWLISRTAAILLEPSIKSPLKFFLPAGSQVNVASENGDFYELENLGWVHKLQVSASDLVFEIVDNAKKFIGLSYVWGGKSSLSGLDCSALAQLAYGFAGKSLPRDSDMQRIYLKRFHQRVKANALEAGDLIFTKGHVMIYAGAGKIIHANGYHMQVVLENLKKALARIKEQNKGELIIECYRWME